MIPHRSGGELAVAKAESVFAIKADSVGVIRAGPFPHGKPFGFAQESQVTFPLGGGGVFSV